MSNSRTPPHSVWPNLLNIDADNADLNWQPLQAGVDICTLHSTDATGNSVALLRYEPGASIPPHLHVGHEYLFILRGSQRDEYGTYRQGTFLINLPEGRHRVVSDEGCLVLAIWETPVEFI